jgi:hypothetical protein
MTVRHVTQLELENFANNTSHIEEEADGVLLSVADVKAKEILYRKTLIEQNKITPEEEIPTYAEVYHDLLNAGIRGRVAAYIAWASMPKKYRFPETQDEFAQQVLGLTSDRAIATWRKKYPEIDQMVADLQAEAMLEYRPGAFHALGTVAADPSYRANPDRRLFFEMTKDYTPRIKNEVDDGKGVGRKVLDQLRKMPTDKMIEALGDEAIQIMKELEDEYGDEDLTPSPFPKVEGESENESHD